MARPVLASEPYCLALRGNGETLSAHWGALANLFEKEGFPQAQAGGSSAAINLLLLDGMMANPLLKTADLEIQKSRSSLAFKAMMGITDYFIQKPEVQAAGLVYQKYQEGIFSFLQFLAGKIWRGEISELSQQLEKFGRELVQNGVGRAPRYGFLTEAFRRPSSFRDFTWEDWKRAAFYSREILNALGALGAFDAESDEELFFRDGLIDFQRMGAGFGKIATFFAGVSWNEKTRENFQEFLNVCEKIHLGKTWEELVAAEPRCQKLLSASLDAYFSQKLNWDKINFVHRKMGSSLTTLSTTTVLLGEAAQETKRTYETYHSHLDRSVATKFKIEKTEEVLFGYWGPSEALAKIQSRLKTPFKDRFGREFNFSDDAKSLRFKSLGSATWSEVMRLTPAEPGLAALQKFTVDGKEAYSAGGWSDLHPMPVLKAYGCDRVIYVTRRGGETLFGQGVAKRVFNFDRPWDVLRNLKPEDVRKNNLLNNTGDPEDLTSTWSLLYNVANPKSSYMRAVAAADAVLCTDWNRYTIQKEFRGLVTQSFHSPYVAGKTSFNLQADLEAAGAQFLHTPSASVAGAPAWAGCYSPE